MSWSCDIYPLRTPDAACRPFYTRAFILMPDAGMGFFTCDVTRERATIPVEEEE
jgi:hypothetical protein